MALTYPVSMRAFGIVLALIPACGVIEMHNCTAIGCTDSASFRILTPDGTRHPYDVTLVIDGREVTCPKPADTSASTQTCTDPNVTISHEEQANCNQSRSGDAVSLMCLPNGTFIQTIRIMGAPSRVDVTLVDGSSSFNHSFEPTYTAVEPNGPDCDPICMQTSEDWTVE